MARVTLQEYLDEARALINQGAYQDAIAVCRHILTRYPRHIRTYQTLAEACLEKGDLEEASDTFKRLLEQADPENFVAHAGLSVLAEEKGCLAEAVWHMERAFEIAPNNEEVRDALRRLYGKRDGTEPTRIKHNKAALARLYAKGGQYRQAIEKFRELLDEETNRDRMDLKIALAETLWRDERREQAAELSGEILQVVPHSIKAILILGMFYLEKGRDEEGQSILAAARSLDPENVLAQSIFGARSPLSPQVVKITRLQKEQEPAEEVIPHAEPETEPERAGEAELGAEVATKETREAEAPAPEEMAAMSTEAEAAAVSEGEAMVTGEVVGEASAAQEAEPVTEPQAAPEPFATAVPAEVAPLPATSMVAPGEEAGAAEEGTEVHEETPAPLAAKKGPSAQETVPAPAVAPHLLTEVEQCKAQLEQQPKDNDARLALARAYRDLEQMQLALEQYRMLKRGRAELLSQVVKDMESIVASRPDNLEAHELLGDLYAKNGQLKQAAERYRWVLHRLEERSA